jgi:Flp pilus assembly protein TadG
MKAMAAWDVARGNDIVVLTRGRRQRRPEEQPKRGRGQALVEFALVVPIMILIFGALVQFAFIFERQIGIENAVRDGARRAATYETVDATDAAVNGPFTWNLVFGSGGLMLTNVQGYDGLAAVSPSVCYRTQTSANGVSSVMVKVSVGYRHPLFLPLISQILDPLDGTTDGALRVDTSSEFQVQNDPTIATSADACYG